MTQTYPRVSRGLNRNTADVFNRKVDMLQWYEQHRDRVEQKRPGMRRRQPRGSSPVGLVSFRTGAFTPIPPGDISRWTYGVGQFVKLDEDGITYVFDDSAFDPADFIHAINLNEATNDGVYPEGRGIVAPPGAILTVQPIAIGSVVHGVIREISDGLIIEFDAPNPLTIECVE